MYSNLKQSNYFIQSLFSWQAAYSNSKIPKLKKLIGNMASALVYIGIRQTRGFSLSRSASNNIFVVDYDYPNTRTP